MSLRWRMKMWINSIVSSRLAVERKYRVELTLWFVMLYVICNLIWCDRWRFGMRNENDARHDGGVVFWCRQCQATCIIQDANANAYKSNLAWELRCQHQNEIKQNTREAIKITLSETHQFNWKSSCVGGNFMAFSTFNSIYYACSDFYDLQYFIFIESLFVWAARPPVGCLTGGKLAFLFVLPGGKRLFPEIQ